LNKILLLFYSFFVPDFEENRNLPQKGRGKRQSEETLNITTILQEPFTMREGGQLEGFCMDMLKELSKKLGFKYSVSVVKDGYYGKLDKDGKWNGMIGEVYRKEADLAVAPLTLTALREENIDFTKPFMHTGIGILLRKDLVPGSPSLFSFLRPFTKETWVGVLVAYLITCLCLFLVARLSPIEWSNPQTENNQFSFLNSLWFGVGALTLQGAQPHPKALSTRIIGAIWWLFTITLLAAYVANFTAQLNTNNQQSTIMTFDDLAKQNVIEYGTLKDSSTLNFFKKSKHPTYRMIYEHMDRRRDYVLVSSMDEGIDRARNSNYALIGESASLDLMVAKYCDLTSVPQVIGSREYGIVASKGSPWIKKLSVAILEMRESGDLEYLRNKWWESSCFNQEGSWSPMEPGSLGGIFLVLAIGLALGLLVALLELVLKSRYSTDQKKSCCGAFAEELGSRFMKT
uniref:Glutamate receptor n=1 Tax=Latimeria chalumnae TaxID=7897 RepID=H3B951_LATCH